MALSLLATPKLVEHHSREESETELQRRLSSGGNSRVQENTPNFRYPFQQSTIYYDIIIMIFQSLSDFFHFFLAQGIHYCLVERERERGIQFLTDLTKKN